jgi:hypothetical protein
VWLLVAAVGAALATLLVYLHVSRRLSGWALVTVPLLYVLLALQCWASTSAATAGRVGRR